MPTIKLAVPRAVALLLVLAAALVPHLKAQTIVSYPVGTGPTGIVFDGINIWVANAISNNVTKLLASTGATVGTYPVGVGPSSLAFDGTNVWVANGGSNTVTKLLASTGTTVGTYLVGADPRGVAFDGTNIWVANFGLGNGGGGPGSNTVTKLLASTGATVGTYPVGSEPGGIAFDGHNIWVSNYYSNNVTKLLASTGANLGTYPAGVAPSGMAFDGTNIWVADTFGTVTKLASTGANLGTYPAGSQPNAVVFDGTNIWVANGGSNSVTKLASTGANLGTYPVGTQPNAVVFDGTNIWVANWGSNSVTKISLASQAAPYISPAGVVPVDSTVSIIQAGEWVSIWGTNLASGTTVWSGNFPTSLGGTSVKINGKAAYLSLVSSGQINLQAPDDNTTGPVPVVVTTANGSATSTVTLGQFAPSFLLIDTKHVAGIINRADGSGAYGVGTYDILGPTGNSLGYTTVAAKAGDEVELFGVGFGPATPAVPAGQAFSGVAPANNPVQLRIGSTIVNPSFAGLSSAGLYQINLTIPVGLGAGDLLLTATVSGAQTSAAISLASAFTGYWTFTAHSSVYGFQSGAVGQLTQSANTISGQLSLSGTPCASSAAVSGTVSGNALLMTLNENGQPVTFSGSVSSDGNSASGTYVAPAGGCTNGDTGTWSGNRQ